MDNNAFAPLAGVLVIALIAAPLATVAISQSAIPGEALYGIKRATEVITAPSALDKLDRRVGELGALAERNPNPTLIGKTLVDIETTVQAVVAEADTADEIDRAQLSLQKAKEQLERIMMDLGDDHPAISGLDTAWSAIDQAQMGLDTAKESLDVQSDADSLSVVP